MPTDEFNCFFEIDHKNVNMLLIVRIDRIRLQQQLWRYKMKSRACPLLIYRLHIIVVIACQGLSQNLKWPTRVWGLLKFKPPVGPGQHPGTGSRKLWGFCNLPFIIWKENYLHESTFFFFFFRKRGCTCTPGYWPACPCMRKKKNNPRSLRMGGI